METTQNSGTDPSAGSIDGGGAGSPRDAGGSSPRDAGGSSPRDAEASSATDPGAGAGGSAPIDPRRDPDRKRKSKKEKKNLDQRKPTLLHRLHYAVFRSVEKITQFMPVSFAYRLGSFFGWLAYYVDGRHRRIAYINLDLAYRDTLTRSEKKRIVKDAFRNMVLLGFDVMMVPRLLAGGSIEKYFDFAGFKAADECKKVSKARIYVSAHHGSWEAIGAAMGVIGHPFVAVARPLNNPLVDEYLIRSRETLGQKIIPKYGVISDFVRRLRAGESLGFVSDQDARRYGIFVDFFGVQASTIVSPALLSYRFDAPIVIGRSIRVGWTFKFRVIIDEVLWPDKTRSRDDEVRRLTQEINNVVERFVREDPGQYLWLHRRFKTRPAGEEPVYE